LCFEDLHCGFIHLPCFADFLPHVITCSNSLLFSVISFGVLKLTSVVFSFQPKIWFSIGFVSVVVLHQLFQFLFDIGFVSFGVLHWFCLSSGLATVTLATVWHCFCLFCSFASVLSAIVCHWFLSQLSIAV
jgi:hypothetical protein